MIKIGQRWIECCLFFFFIFFFYFNVSVIIIFVCLTMHAINFFSLLSTVFICLQKKQSQNCKLCYFGFGEACILLFTDELCFVCRLHVSGQLKYKYRKQSKKNFSLKRCTECIYCVLWECALYNFWMRTIDFILFAFCMYQRENEADVILGEHSLILNSFTRHKTEYGSFSFENEIIFVFSLICDMFTVIGHKTSLPIQYHRFTLLIHIRFYFGTFKLLETWNR